MKRFYLPQLDSLRLLAFLLVFQHHNASAAQLFPAGSRLGGIVHRFGELGWSGVDLFLVLSAFLITSLLLLEHDAAGRISLRDFYARRILRIWPLYYLMVVIGFILLPLIGVFAPRPSDSAYADLVRSYLIPYATLYGNFAVAIHGFAPVWTLSHLWTIAMEEHFYLFWPLVLVAVVRWPRPRRWLLLGAVLALTIGLRALFWSQTRHPFICTNTLTRLDPLVVGIVLAVWRKGRAPSQGAIGPLLEFLGGCVVVSLVALAPSIRLQTSNVVWQYLATAVGYGLMLDGAIASRRGPLTWALSLKPFVFLGRLTYGLYIYHILGLQFGHLCFVHLGRLLQVRSSPVAWAIQTTLALALTVAAATVSYYTFEAFFLSLKTKFTHIASRPNPWKSPESPAAAPDRAPESACSPTSSQTAS